jgi:hypothetical protein
MTDPDDIPTGDRSRIDIKAIYGRLPKGAGWDKFQPMGDDGWWALGVGKGIIVTHDIASDPGTDWLHASIAYREPNRFPSYGDLKMLHHAVWGEGHAYLLFVPTKEHINITRNVLHLWGRLDGKAALPNFGWAGTI